jgi:hypothetical protein
MRKYLNTLLLIGLVNGFSIETNVSETNIAKMVALQGLLGQVSGVTCGFAIGAGLGVGLTALFNGMEPYNDMLRATIPIAAIVAGSYFGYVYASALVVHHIGKKYGYPKFYDTAVTGSYLSTLALLGALIAAPVFPFPSGFVIAGIAFPVIAGVIQSKYYKSRVMKMIMVPTASIGLNGQIYLELNFII